MSFAILLYKTFKQCLHHLRLLFSKSSYVYGRVLLTTLITKASFDQSGAQLFTNIFLYFHIYTMTITLNIRFYHYFQDKTHYIYLTENQQASFWLFYDMSYCFHPLYCLTYQYIYIYIIYNIKYIIYAIYMIIKKKKWTWYVQNSLHNFFFCKAHYKIH